MDVSHLSTNNLLAYKRFPIFTVKLQPGSCRSSLALVCPMPRYSANSFTLSNAFSIKLRCHVSALPLSTSFFPYYFALRYVTMGVLIWLFLSVKGLSGIDRISPLTFSFVVSFFSFIPVRFLLSPAPRRGDLLSHISYKTPLPPGSILSH